MARLAVQEHDQVLTDGVDSFPFPVGTVPGESSTRKGEPIDDISP